MSKGLIQLASTAPSLKLWGTQSPWNMRPINPVLNNVVIPSATSNFPSIGTGVLLDPAVTLPTAIGATFILDELTARNFTLPYFPNPPTITSGSDHACDFYDPLTNQIMDFWILANTGTNAYSCHAFDTFPVTGTGWGNPARPSGVRASSVPWIAGALRIWEQNLPMVNHALQISIDQASLSVGPKYPACTIDGTHTAYTNTSLRLGSLLMLPSNFPLAGLATSQAKAIARTLQVYGGYIVDTTGTGSGGWSIGSEPGSTWNLAQNGNPSPDLALIRNSLREVVTSDGWLDGNGNPFTPTPWTAMNILSMRGTWTAQGGGALGANPGFFNTITGSYEFSDTSVTPGVAFTNQAGRYFRNYNTANSWTGWQNGVGNFYINPVPGRSYTLSATGTGTTASGFIRIYSGNFTGPLFDSNQLFPGQSQTFVWPIGGVGAMSLYVIKTPGSAASIDLALTPVSPQNFYVDSIAGSDSNDGLTTATPWKTIAHVNAQSFIPGDTINLAGGQIFTDALVVTSSGYMNLPITFTSYGVGQATIAVGASEGISIGNNQYITINNLNIQGTNTGNFVGIHAFNSGVSGINKLDGITISNVTVNNFSGNGIHIQGTVGSNGFNRFVIHKATVSNCGGGSAGGNGIVVSGANYGSGISTPAHTNSSIDGCTVFSNPGSVTGVSWSGSGIFLGQSSSVIIQNCTVHDNGTNGSGMYGIWATDGTLNTIQYNEVYGQKSTSTKGGGIALEGGLTASYALNNYTHDNYGPGLTAASYNDGSVTTWTGNYILSNISQNDGTGYATNLLSQGGIFIQNTSGSTMTGCYVLSNTVYNNISNSVINVIGTPANSFVLNNILYAGASINIVNCVGTAPTASQLLFNYNDYFSTGTFAIFWNASSYASLAAWQTGTSFVQEFFSGSAVGITTNPNLVNAGGGGITNGYNPASLSAYQVHTGSPVIGTGKLPTQFNYNNSAVKPASSIDYFGNYQYMTNPATFNPSIGAYSGFGV